MPRFLIVLIIILLTGQNLFAENKNGQKLIDSIIQVLPKTAQDTNKVKLLQNIANTYNQSNLPDSAIRYGNLQLQLATQLKWQNGIASGNNILGMAYSTKKETKRSLAYYERALKIYEQTDSREAATVTYNIGVLYRNANENAQAIQYFYKALKICETTGMCALQANCYSRIAIVYGVGKDFTSAVAFHTKALNIAEKCAEVDSSQLLRFYSNLAVSCQYKGDCERSLPYSFKALKLAQELGETWAIVNMNGNLSLAYTTLREYQKAIYYGEREFTLGDSLRDEKYVALSLYALGHAYLSLIMDTSLSAEKQKLSLGDDRAQIRIALNYLERGLDSCHGTLNEADLEVKICEDLAKVYRLTGNWKKALQIYDMFVTLRDSIFSKETGAQLLTQQMKYDLDKKEVARLAMQEREDMRQRNIRNSILAGMGGLLFFSIVVIRQRNKVKKEQAKSEQLLLNILPAEVAEELKSTGSTTARHFDNVTVLFTDFVGFTTVSEQLSPKQLVDELHTCFTAFDGIMVKHSIEKIKTVGDAYLAVSGLPLPNDKHAENVVSAAIEIRDFMLARKQELGDIGFNVRIGIHSGNVVAGIVGVKKFAYDIWGDTVNTAARMEQKSEPGKINISQVTYELIKGKYSCMYRGEIEAKNKGMMKMYFVHGITA